MMDEASFTFVGYNSLTDYGIYMTAYDDLFPQKRERKEELPFADGRYDHGTLNREERKVIIQCHCVKEYTRAEFREFVYWINQKGKLVLGEEPDKYYIGEVFSPASINYENFQRMIPFELTFICKPYAYKEVQQQAIKNGNNKISYNGTACTPCTIIIKNPNNYAVNNINIVLKSRN